MHGDGGTLWIEAHRDAVAARDFHGSVDNPPAILREQCRGMVRARHAHVAEPMRRCRNVRGRIVDSAHLSARAPKHLVCPGGTHVHRGRLLPTKQRMVERECGAPVGRRELVPRELAGFDGPLVPWRDTGRAEHGKGRALWVGENREAPDIRDIPGLHVRPGAQSLSLVHCSVDIRHRHVREPMGRRAHLLRLVGEREHSADRDTVDGPHSVRWIRRKRHNPPSHHGRIESFRRAGVRGHQVVPDEAAAWIDLRHLFLMKGWE